MQWHEVHVDTPDSIYCDYENFRNAVINGVRSQIGHKPWYRGICTDGLKDLFKDRAPLEDAIAEVQMQTELWDGPDIMWLLKGNDSDAEQGTFDCELVVAMCPGPTEIDLRHLTPQDVPGQLNLAIEALGGQDLYSCLRTFLFESGEEDLTGMSIREVLAEECCGTWGCSHAMAVAVLTLTTFGYGLDTDERIVTSISRKSNRK